MRGSLSGWEHEEPCNFGAWALGEEVVEVAPSLPWREGELHSAREMSMGGAELEDNHYFGSRELNE